MIKDPNSGLFFFIILIFIVMEYIGLNNITNTYPNISSYKKKSLNEIRLNGLYNGNFLDFQIPSLEDVEVVDGTTFRFIIAIRYSEDDDEIIGLYTSPIFYTELVTSINENNPYFIQNVLNPSLIVSYFLNDITPLYNSLIEFEKEMDVRMVKNLAFLENGVIDYPSIVRYIDWIVSSPKISEIGQNNVLPISTISDYQLATYEPDTMLFSQIDETYKENKLLDLQNRLDNINQSLFEIEDYLKNPDPVKLNAASSIGRIVGSAGIATLQIAKTSLITSVLGKIGLASAFGPIGAAVGLLVGGVLGLIKSKKNKQRQERELEEVLNKLKAEVIILKEQKLNIESEISKIN